MASRQDGDVESIKEYEKAKRAKTKPAEEVRVIDFDQWWAERSSALKQPSHIREILKADAGARGLVGKQPSDKWDWAARQFGLTI